MYSKQDFNMTPTEFIAKYSSAVVKACVGTGIFPSVKLAQMALETGWGKAIPANNAFGIKAKGATGKYWDGSVYNSRTKEVINGQTISIVDGFRAYESVQDSISDHNEFLKVNSRYTKAGVFSAATPEDQARALLAAGYATDPGYADKLISIINKYGLKSLDEKKKR
jgi:flagellum-specific peptidoglycan hydrolase FlgJ